MNKQTTSRVAIIGTVGVPCKYGGFETLAENLVRYHRDTGRRDRLTVYCSARDYPMKPPRYLEAELCYLPLSANGVQSVLYDILSVFWAVVRGETHLLILGVSGCICLPFLRRLTRVRVICNIDGIEWKREKWKGAAKWFLKLSEKIAVNYSDIVIADNKVIGNYVSETYGRDCMVIAYGGDHALVSARVLPAPEGLPEQYTLALCRIEPENNVHIILEAFAGLDNPLVFVGNWNNSAYGRKLKALYSRNANFHLLDPIYEAEALYAIRSRAKSYVHGHSAGGTNPSLVEMMHFGIPIFAHGCAFNRHSTEDKAHYFETPAELATLVLNLAPEDASSVGVAMQEIARRRYTWVHIGEAYFELLERV